MRNPDLRLGSGDKGVENVKNHIFFESVNWDLIEKQLNKSPFKPKIKSDADPEYVDEEFKNMSPKDSPCESVGKEDSQLFSSLFNFYLEFSYDNELDLNKEFKKINILI